MVTICALPENSETDGNAPPFIRSERMRMSKMRRRLKSKIARNEIRIIPTVIFKDAKKQ